MAVHSCVTHPCPVCMTPAPQQPSDHPYVVVVPAEEYERLTCDDDQPTSCPCECHKPKREARKPHPNTMAGRK